MHLLRTDQRSLDETAQAVDLEQTPADIVALSFADSDLARAGASAMGRRRCIRSLRLALARPAEASLFGRSLCREGAAPTRASCWCGCSAGSITGATASRSSRAPRASTALQLAIVPGDHREDARLDAASTLPAADLRRIWAYFRERRAGEYRRPACDFIATRISGAGAAAAAARRSRRSARSSRRCAAGAGGRATRADRCSIASAYLAGDDAPITRARRGARRAKAFAFAAVYVTSLKDAAAARLLAQRLAAEQPDVILNATAFSARLDGGAACSTRPTRRCSRSIQLRRARPTMGGVARAASAADLAMNVVLPEVDGRIFAGAISFKARAATQRQRSNTRRCAPRAADVAHRLRRARSPRAGRACAARRTRENSWRCILSDYPAKGGRAGYAVGLDTPRSAPRDRRAAGRRRL